ncbi:MAG TPA: hypothetical protein VN803_02800 [Gemmatimonadales bacterium]|nr:hypothetical protein [Gemmatimonadales bacterium]
MMRVGAGLTILSGLLLVACSPDRATAPAPTLNASSWGPETPPFNFEAILRSDAGGFGHVKVRQPNDGETVFHLDTWVRDLQPNTAYRLQRAVDTNVDDVCVGTAWLTLGLGPTPFAIVTDDKGTGRAPLWRVVTSPIGTKFDVHFRVIEDATGAVVLESACYQFVITQ